MESSVSTHYDPRRNYYWFIFLIELNVLFSVAAVVAWVRDAHYERKLEARHAA